MKAEKEIYSVQKFFNEEIRDFWKFVSELAKQCKLSFEDWMFIAESGTFNRLFRRWYQTAWLQRSWCDSFNGTTPKQFVERNIAHIFHFDNIHWYISCYIDEKNLFEKKQPILSTYIIPYSFHNHNKKYEYLPLMSSFEDLEELFTKGASANHVGNLNKIYTDHWRRYFFQDRDFLFWATRMLWNKGLLKFVPSSRPKVGKAVLNSKGKAYFSLEAQDQLPSFIKYSVFEAVSRIISEIIEEIIPKKKYKTFEDKVRELCKELTMRLKEIIFTSEWINLDDFLLSFWDIVQEMFQDRLLNSRVVCKLLENQGGYWEEKEPLKTIVTKYAFGRFASAFDSYFLFPFNWYFGLVECVWSDYELFTKDLLYYFSLAQQLSGKSWFYSEDRGNFNAFCNTFFVPCTCFKFIDGVSKVKTLS